MEKLILTPMKPRNPFVRASRFRLAGAHVESTGQARRRAARELRHELDRLKP